MQVRALAVSACFFSARVIRVSTLVLGSSAVRLPRRPLSPLPQRRPPLCTHILQAVRGRQLLASALLQH